MAGMKDNSWSLKHESENKLVTMFCFLHLDDHEEKKQKNPQNHPTWNGSMGNREKNIL